PVGISAALVRLQNLDATREAAVQVPGLAAPDMIVEAVRAVLGEDHNVENIGINAVTQSKVNNSVLPSKRDGRLGSFGSQRGKSGSLAFCQDQGACSHRLNSFSRLVQAGVRRKSLHIINYSRNRAA